MKATYLAFQYPNGRLELCEGGVFSDAPRGEYAGNTLEHGEAERLRLNTERPANQAGYYVTLDSAIGVTADETVWESLEEWQRAEFQLSGSADLADLAASDSPHAADLARNLAALRRGEPSAFAAVVASASLLESNAALNRGAAKASAELVAKLATDAANVAGSMNGDALRASDVAAADGMAAAMEMLARGLAESDYPAAYNGLCQLLANGRKLADLLAGSKAAHATCAASLSAADSRLANLYGAAAFSLADRTQLRRSPFAAARIAGRYLESFAESRKPADLAGVFDALRELERQACEKAGEARDATAALHALQSVNAANAEARAKAESDVAAYREQRDAEGERAAKAEWRLADYRALLAPLPFGLTRAYPAALPLLRAYLADVESDG